MRSVGPGRCSSTAPSSSACVLSGDALQALHCLLAGLEVFPERMLDDLDLTGGLINAEAVMLDLARTLGRQKAHHLVHDIAAHVATTPDAWFEEALLADPVVGASLNRDRVRTLIDATSYLGPQRRRRPSDR